MFSVVCRPSPELPHAAGGMRYVWRACTCLVSLVASCVHLTLEQICVGWMFSQSWWVATAHLLLYMRLSLSTAQRLPVRRANKLPPNYCPRGSHHSFSSFARQE